MSPVARPRHDATWIADLMAYDLIRAALSRTRHSRNCGPCCGPASIDARANTPCPAPAEDAGRGQHQVGLRDQRRHGPLRRRMVEAMIAGERNPQKLAALADQRIKASPKALYDALHGRLADHHRFRLRLHMRSTTSWPRRSERSTRRSTRRSIRWMRWRRQYGLLSLPDPPAVRRSSVNTLSAQTILAKSPLI